MVIRCLAIVLAVGLLLQPGWAEPSATPEVSAEVSEFLTLINTESATLHRLSHADPSLEAEHGIVAVQIKLNTAHAVSADLIEVESLRWMGWMTAAQLQLAQTDDDLRAIVAAPPVTKEFPQNPYLSEAEIFRVNLEEVVSAEVLVPANEFPSSLEGDRILPPVPASPGVGECCPFLQLNTQDTPLTLAFRTQMNGPSLGNAPDEAVPPQWKEAISPLPLQFHTNAIRDRAIELIRAEIARRAALAPADPALTADEG